MTMSIIPNADLKLLRQTAEGSEIWQSFGGDPAFKITYPFVRLPVVTVEIFSVSEQIDPKIYLNRGRGFAEDDTLSFIPGTGFIFLVDVGAVGSLRAFRVDPTSSSSIFEWRVRSFAGRESAKQYANGLLTSKGDAKLIEVNNIPRYGLPSIRFPDLRRRKDPTAAYLDANYALAAQEATPSICCREGCWLSIIVPVYNTPARYLQDLLGSFRTQGVEGVELVLSDDGSTSLETRSWLDAHSSERNLHVVYNKENRGIAAATNAGLQIAGGDWVAFLDHDDLIAPHALKIIGKAIDTFTDAHFFFSDEVVVDDRLRPKGLMLKPAFDPVLLSGVNYINHFSVYRRSRLAEIGFLRLGYDGSQDYDLLLRYLDGLPAEKVRHIPYPAYWWRHTGRSYSTQFLAKATLNARRAIADSFARRGRAVEVQGAITETLHKVAFLDLAEAWPKVSIIIPSKNSIELICRILKGVFEETDYPNFEVIVVDNGSEDSKVLALYEEYERRFENFSVKIVREDFNFSRSVNRGIQIASGDHVLLLNNDTEVIEAWWLREMVQCLSFEKAGIVGAKLLYPNDTIQHAGVIVGFGGLAGHWYSEKSKDFGGPMNRLHVRNSLSCVTGAAMLISGECLKAVGKWDEINFPVAYNDVDYCLRARNEGYRVIWTPFSCLYHHESLSRGSDATGTRRQRFEKEKDRLRTIHATSEFRDPAINPGYSTDRSDPVGVPPAVLAVVR